MSNTPSDAELIAELEAAGVAFMAFRGGAGLTKEIWTTSGSQDAKKIATGIRAVLAKWGTPQPVVREPLSANQVSGLAESAGYWHGDMSRADFINGIRDAEAAHGITQKGCQHGTE